MSKIIDFEKKGNVVRFYLGNEDCDDYWGDDWNDTPYEHNAEEVYDEFKVGYIDAAFPYDCAVLEPSDDYYNTGSPYNKEDMKNRVVPCIIVVPQYMVIKMYWDPVFTRCVGGSTVTRFYFNDINYRDKIIDCGGVIINEYACK